MSDDDVRGLALNMPRIRARERLEFCVDVMSAMPADDKAPPQNLVELVRQAYPDDERTRAILLEALTRR